MTQHTRSGRPRKAASLVAVTLATSMVLSACGGGGDDSGSGDGRSVSILVVKHPLTKKMADMAWVAELEKNADVDITWEEVSADWDQKKNPMLAAGDVPDLIIGVNGITDSDLATFGTLFEDLSDDMDALPNVQEMFDEVDGAELMATSLDGQVYSIPSYKKFWPQAITHQYINQQWLDTLGLAQPTTWDELYDVLVAFKAGDPNGNGQADEIPLDFAPVVTTGFGYFQPTALLGSTGMTTSGGGSTGIIVDDGTVKNFFVDERYKDMIAFYHRCWEAGLISEEAFTQDYSTYQSVARGTGDQARVGFTWGWSGSDRFGPGVYEQYAPMAPLRAEAGQSDDPSWSYDYENLTRNHITMSASAQNKDATLRVIDEFYSTDTSMQVLFGDIPTNVEKVSDTDYKVLPPADANLDPSTWKWTSSLADNGPIFIREDLTVELPSDLAEAVEDAAPLQPAFDALDVDANVWPGPFVKMSSEDLSTVALNNTAILGIAMPKFAQWITAGGVEEEWDEYVGQLESLGVTQNDEIHQKYYDAYIESK